MNDTSVAPASRVAARRAFAVVALGASAGGLEALQELLRHARREDRAAYVVIQHLDPTHDSVLAELLERRAVLTVQQAQDGMEVQPGHVYTIPPGARMLISDGRLKLMPFDQPRGLRRPIDDFFESLAHDFGAAAACVILSGTGADGTLGLRAIKEHGGVCVVQEPSTARYDGMPMSAEATGLVDYVLPPDRIVPTILQYFQSSESEMAEEVLLADARRICQHLLDRTGHDFGGYKMSTLVRRIRRRLQVLNLTSTRDYLRHMQVHDEECDALLNEFLINVTRFFRDPELFEAMREKAIRPLVAAAGDDDIRVWVPGCSSGEEAYSVAMLLDAELRAAGKRPRFIVFASDIDRRMVEIARSGCYPSSALADIPEPFRSAYTIRRDAQLQIVPQLRDRVRFSMHSLVRDPPFNRVDMISCRNLLIYLDEELQARILPLFHYALRPGGYLFLGPSEGVRREAQHFAELDRHARLFQRDRAPARLPLELPLSRRGGEGADNMDMPPMRGHRAAPHPAGAAEGSAAAAQKRLVERYAPVSLQVSDSGEVVWTAGRLARFIRTDPIARGPLHVSSILQPGLRDAVLSALDEVAHTGRPVVVRDLHARSEIGSQPVTLFVEPLPDRSALVVFQESGAIISEIGQHWEVDDLRVTEGRTERLEEELRHAQNDLRSAVEELETANEELKSSNEEMMAMNEELQSTNEELSTVNDELKSKVDDLVAANADLQNFFSATKIPLLVLDRQMRIRNYTVAALEIFPLRRTDHGRPLADVANAFGPDLLERMAAEVVETGEAQTTELHEAGRGRTWRVDLKPYRAADGYLEGTMLIFEDVTTLRELRQAVERQDTRLKSVRKLARIAVWQYDAATEMMTIDDSSDLLGIGDTTRLPLTAFAALIGTGDRQAFIDDLGACARGGAMRRIISPSAAGRGEVRLEAAGDAIGTGPTAQVMGVLLDVTAVESAARLREAVIHEMDHRVKNLFTQISAMLRMAARHADSPQMLAEEVSGRINALAQSHSLTTRRSAASEISLEQLVRTTLAPYAGAALDLAGPEVLVRAAKVLPLSLIFHELATNAFKYGVLGAVTGRLQVRWRITGEHVELDWSEDYEQPQEMPEPREGFGSTLLEGSAAQLDAEIEVEQQPMRRLTRFRF